MIWLERLYGTMVAVVLACLYICTTLLALAATVGLVRVLWAQV